MPSEFNNQTSNNIQVPRKNSSSNINIQDVVGNKTDDSFNLTSDTDIMSLVGYLKGNYYHIHAPSKVYPDLADPVTLVTSTTSWEYGSIVEIVPANTISLPFDIHWIYVSDLDTNAQYQLQLYSWDVGSEVVIWTIAFFRDGNFNMSWDIRVQIPPQSPDTRISAALTSNSTNADTVDIKISYHEYPN